MAFVTQQKQRTQSNSKVISPNLCLMASQKSLEGMKHGFGARYLKKRQTGEQILLSSDQHSLYDGASTAAGTQCQSPQGFQSPSKATVCNARSMVGSNKHGRFQSMACSPMSPVNIKLQSKAHRDLTIQKETMTGFLPKIKSGANHNLLGKLDSFKSLGKSVGAQGRMVCTTLTNPDDFLVTVDKSQIKDKICNLWKLIEDQSFAQFETQIQYFVQLSSN
jgi:hypothetical protein